MEIGERGGLLELPPDGVRGICTGAALKVERIEAAGGAKGQCVDPWRE